MTVYYIDSVHGSDSNNGLSTGAALQSLSQVTSLGLKAGDSILLARGSVFTDTLTLNKSGTEGNPIKIDAYGQGENPILKGDVGINGTKASNISVANLTIADTKGAAINIASAKNWVVDNVDVLNTGTSSGIGGIIVNGSSNVTIQNSGFDGVWSDGIFAKNADGFTAINNNFTNMRGHTADGIQVMGGKNITVNGNQIDQSNSPDSTKGGIMMDNVTNVTVNDNVLIGGSFGVGVYGWNVTISDNEISGVNKYGWSAAVLIGGDRDLTDYTVTGNTISDSQYGVSITGLAQGTTRKGMEISGNSFTDMIGAAIKVDWSSDGVFENNTIVNSTVSLIKGAGLTGDFPFSGNTTLTSEQAAKAAAGTPRAAEHAPSAPAEAVVAPAPVQNSQTAAPATTPVLNAPGAYADKVTVDATGHAISGNLLANDVAASGGKLAIATAGSQAVNAAGVEIKGTYGVLHIQADGDYSYTLNANAASVLQGVNGAVEKFQYKANEKGAIYVSKLEIDLQDYVYKISDGSTSDGTVSTPAPPPTPTPKATPSETPSTTTKLAAGSYLDFGAVNAAGTASGNILDNDVSGFGAVMRVATAGGKTVSAAGVDIKGIYGTLHIESDGDYSYTLNADAATTLKGVADATERFLYKASDASAVYVSKLAIDLSTYVDAHHLL